MTLAEKIQETRRTQGITTPELAYRLGICQGTLESYQEGKRIPTDDRYSTIREWLRIDLAEMAELCQAQRKNRRSVIQKLQKRVEDLEANVASLSGVVAVLAQRLDRE